MNPYILRRKIDYREEHKEEQATFARMMAEQLWKLDNDVINISGIISVNNSRRLKQKYYFETARHEIREISGMAIPAKLKGLIEYYRLQGR